MAFLEGSLGAELCYPRIWLYIPEGSNLRGHLPVL